jgi:hypothetical protein
MFLSIDQVFWCGIFAFAVIRITSGGLDTPQPALDRQFCFDLVIPPFSSSWLNFPPIIQLYNAYSEFFRTLPGYWVFGDVCPEEVKQ